MGLLLFYHLTRSTPEDLIAQLLPRALAQGWRVMIRGRDRTRLDALDQQLWLGAVEAFLPHGLEGGPHDADQPVLLGAGPIANGAQALMLIEGADPLPGEAETLERVWVVFDGNDPVATDRARGQWRDLTGRGLGAQYWSEESGRWEKKSEKPAAP